MRATEALSTAAGYLARHGVESPRETAEVLLGHFLGTDRAGLYARSEPVDARTVRSFGRALRRRRAGTPLQYLTGEQKFLDVLLAVAPGVFVPRPETEGLVLAAEEVLTETPSPVVVDVGTGTGAIALALKRRRPDAHVIATDVSEKAVVTARANAATLGLDVDVREGDLLAPVPPGFLGKVDLVVSNPPYVTPAEYASLPPEVRAEPAEALLGGIGVYLRLEEEGARWLRPGGWLILEIAPADAPAVDEILAPRFHRREVLPDLAGRDRVVRGRLIG
jgi:release factor glutamine methyltransferase